MRKKAQGGIILDWRLTFWRANTTEQNNGASVEDTAKRKRFMRCLEVEKSGNKGRVKFRKKKKETI